MPELIECPACKSKISSDAGNCLKCGQPITDEIRKQAVEKQKADKINGITGCVTLIIIIFVAGYFFSRDDKTADKTKTEIARPQQSPASSSPAIEQEPGFIDKYSYGMPKDEVARLSGAKSCGDDRPQDLCINSVKINDVNLTERFFFNKNNGLDSIFLMAPLNEENLKNVANFLVTFDYVPILAKDGKTKIDAITILKNNENINQKFTEFIKLHALSGNFKMICAKTSEIKSLPGKIFFDIDGMMRSLTPHIPTFTLVINEKYIEIIFMWPALGSGNI